MHVFGSEGFRFVTWHRLKTSILEIAVSPRRYQAYAVTFRRKDYDSMCNGPLAMSGTPESIWAPLTTKMQVRYS